MSTFKICCACSQSALRTAHVQLQRESHDGAPKTSSHDGAPKTSSHDGARVTSSQAEEQYLTAAVLAWRQLGHSSADSLYEFIQSKQRKREVKDNKSKIEITKRRSLTTPRSLAGSSSFDTTSPKAGPVVKLPLNTKTITRVDNAYQRTGGNNLNIRRVGSKSHKTPGDDYIKSKISDACCMDPTCAAKLSELDTMTSELRTRATGLARREIERLELLERAEAAWKDLELCYQRRWNLAEEKENDLIKEIKETLEERNAYKNFCKNAMDDLKNQGAEAEEFRERLTIVDEEICCHARYRLQLSEECAREDATLSELHCRVTQLDRDLQFKEQQARLNITNLENDIASSRGLFLEAERVLRSDLKAIKDNIKNITKEISKEDTKNSQLRSEVDRLRQQKSELAKDQETCKLKYNSGIQGKLDELKAKTQKFAQLTNKVIESRCKLPRDVSVEVKRTPSFAALCYCTEEDGLKESCSCSSLRGQLMSNLLRDLFGGLQSELRNNETIMPCPYLKCLEDGYNWDRSTALKSNLNHYFSKLHAGELDIAIATSIEKYHAKWVAESCTDRDREEKERELQEQAVERRAQTLAAELAEQLFNARVDELTRNEKNGRNYNSAVYSCLVKPPTARKMNDPSFLKRTFNDVTQLRAQVEELKKESIKKEDLRHMEHKLTKIINRASRVITKSKNKDNLALYTSTGDKTEKERNVEQASYNKKMMKFDEIDSCCIRNKISSKNKVGRIIKHTTKKDIKKIEKAYAVNLCLCNTQKISKNVKNLLNLSEKACNKPKKQDCPKECNCFHKVPSNTSLDKMFNTLTSWNSRSEQRLKKIIKIYEYHPESEFVLKKVDFKNINKEKVSENLNNALITVSDYMGAINYDKSNENCMCVVNSIDSKGGNMQIKDEKHINQCYVDNECERRAEINEKYVKDELHVSDIIENSKMCTENCKCSVKFLGAINYDKSNEHCMCVVNSNDSKGGNMQIKEEKHINQCYVVNECERRAVINEKYVNDELLVSDIIENSKMCAEDCKCSVKFLGVTIADNSNSTFNPKMRQYKQWDKTNKNKITNKVKTQTSSNIGDTTKTSSHKIPDSKLRKCTRKSKEELSKCNTENEKESCVCCDKVNVSDIEVNAFNLLKEHLKGKINNLKQLFTTPISELEVEKIYMNILNEVKRLITDSTSEVSCKCLLKNHEGSWMRAYDLLKEYLKIKIERVKCSCNRNNNTDTILPNLLQKVSLLIENDFERLKMKYKNGSDDKIERFSSYENKNNMSAQVSINFNSQNKSSDPKSVRNIPCVEREVSCKLGNNIYVTDCDCRYHFINKNDHIKLNNQIICNDLQYNVFDKETNLSTENYINLNSLEQKLKINKGDEPQKEVSSKNINKNQDASIVLQHPFNTNNATFIDSDTVQEMKEELFYPKSKDTELNKQILYGYLDLSSEPLPNIDNACNESYSCDCVNVPICHVKMFVDDINNKLKCSKCICDSLSKEVCPMHSKTI